MRYSWQCCTRSLTLGPRPWIMGIVNATPDSFSDGGLFRDPGKAVEHALKLVEEGADILDIGGESSRPGSVPVSLEEELARVVPVVVELVRKTSVPISIDTTKAEVARRCLELGALIVNDITGLRGDPEMVKVVRGFGAGAIVMHMQGTPTTMQVDPHYDDVAGEVGQFFADRISELAGQGIGAEQIVLDPGIGFGKTREHNLSLLRELAVFRRFDRPVCLGVSRKGAIGLVTGRAVTERLAGSLAVACWAMSQEAAQILRVHDVAATRDAISIWHQMVQSRG